MYRSRLNYAALMTLIMLGTPATAQMASPGAPEIARVAAGTYSVDTGHTQIAWAINHLGFSIFRGMCGGVTGSLLLDPKHPEAASLSITIPMEGLVTTSSALNTHLKSADFFNAAQFPTATFKSTSVKVQGEKATITGDLTLHGVTRPIEMEAAFFGAGTNPMSKKLNVGFNGSARIKRSEFGMKLLLPALSDDVEIRVVAAFLLVP